MKELWWMNICDKTDIDKIIPKEEAKGRCCPPHYLPHKLPFGEKICNEKCHVHRAKWRMAHHISFCKVLKCKNFDTMIKAHKIYLRFQKENQSNQKK